MAFTHNQTCTPRDLNGGTIRGWMHTNGLQTNIYDQSHFLSIYFREARRLIDERARRAPDIVDLARANFLDGYKRDEDLYIKSRALGVAVRADNKST